MPALDKLLVALPDSRVDRLVLAPGRRPALCCGEGEREITRTVLDGATIGRLLAEVAPSDGQPDGRWEFDYNVGARSFHFVALEGEQGWLASVSCPSPAQEEALAEGGSETANAVEIPDVATLLALAVERGASDLHLTSGQPPRLRVDGDLGVVETYRAPRQDLLERLLLAITPESNREELAAAHETDFSFELPGQARFRANVYRELNGIAAAFRQIPTRIPTAEELGLPDVVQKIAALSKGLVLVVGATGSGKSTTLAALVDRINRTRGDHLLTIEDPVEFVHPSRRSLVHQRQVGQHTRSFPSALRAALREDPDVVLVGEMRDLETTAIAITTAETGHLVFGTLHTTSAASTVERIIEQYPADQQAQIRLMLASSLRAVICQVLLKKTGGGRVAAFEILLVTPAVANLIREGKTFQIPSAMQTGRRQGMTLLDDSLLALVERKLVDPAEAYRSANHKDEFANRLRAAGADLALPTTDSSECVA